MSNSCFWILLIALLVGANFPLELNAFQSDSNAAKSELPEHAIWRIGKAGETTDANGIYRLAYSKDGRMLATRDRENVVTILDVPSRQQLCEIQGHENNWIETLDFSPDSKYIVTAAGSSEQIKIWNTQTGKLENEIDTDGKSAYFSKDGNRIYVLGLKHVEVYSWPGIQLIEKKQWQKSNGQRSAMSYDGQLVVSYRSEQRRIYQTQVTDLTNRSKINLAGPTSYPKTVIISPNKIWVAATYNRDPKIRLWDLRDPHKAKYELNGHDETVQSIGFSPDNRFLISTGWDEKAVAWDLVSRQKIGEYKGHSEHVNATAVSPLDYTFATGASGTTDVSVLVWSLKQDLFPIKSTDKRATFEQIWSGMGASFLKTSLSATTGLVERPEVYLGELEKRILQQTQQVDRDRVNQAIQQLDSPNFDVREKSTLLLMKYRGQADAELRKILETTVSAEARYRIHRILKQPIERPKINFTDLRRWHRIIFALERINSPRSLKLLQRISTSHSDIDIANDAKAAIERNEVRASF